ncbi:MAG TPA: auxin-responsive protein, partial [Patescibacteria group bacterium]|nr:auxin-responsive protein [Patescibacteria group bacterium]
AIVHEHLQVVDSDYKDIESLLGKDPLRITLLPVGAFNKHMQKNGSKLIKMNPSKDSIDELVKCS